MASKEDRIRGYTGDLKALKDFPPSPKTLEELEAKWDLVPDDYNQVKKMASGHGSRMLRAMDAGDWDLAAEEAHGGLALGSGDVGLIRTWLEALEETPPPENKKALFAPLIQGFSRMEITPEDRGWLKKTFPGIKSSPKKTPFKGFSPKTIRTTAIILGGVILGLLAYFLVFPMILKNTSAPGTVSTTRSQGIEVTLDAQGKKADFIILKSELQFFQEAIFYQIQGKLVFPSEDIGQLTVQVILTDKEGKTLSSDTLELLTAASAPAPRGTGISLTYQKDAGKIYSAIKDATIRITSAAPAQLTAPLKSNLAFENPRDVPAGMEMDLKVIQDFWSKGLSQYTHRIDLLVTNKGQRPIKELTLEAWWTAPDEELFRKDLRVLTGFGPALSPGQSASLRVSQEFSLESWPLPEFTWPTFHLKIKEIQ